MRKLFAKICYALAFSASALAFAFLGASCGENSSSGRHRHDLGAYYDKDYHWKKCEGCGEIFEKGWHVLNADGECVDCYAFSGEIEHVEYEEMGDHAVVVGCKHTSEKVRILSTYNGLPVTEIAEGALRDNSIWGVSIPESVTIIGKSAFENCKALRDVMLPDELTDLGEAAFQDCQRLTNIVIPDKVKSISKFAFSGCKKLTDVEILGGSLKTIGERAFEYCESLTELRLPEGLTAIEKYAFYECVGLAVVELPETLATMGECAFFSCKSLTNIRIPSKITAIEKETFKYCNKLASVELPNGLKTVGSEAFAYCVSLSITLPDSLTGIERSAFNECVNLTNIRIPKKVEIIGNRAFNGCTKLASVELAEGITTVIEEMAFRECPNLQYNVYGNARYLGNEKNPYLALMGKAKYDYECSEIHEDTKIIAALALSGMTNATSIIIPDGVTHIGAYAFQDCENLTAVIIPKSVVYIGEKAFDCCEKVTFYCKAASQPDGWHETWNHLNREVVWNY